MTKPMIIMVCCTSLLGCVTPYREPSGKYLKTAQTEIRSAFGTNQSFGRMERCDGPVNGAWFYYTNKDFKNCVLLTKAEQDEWRHAASRGSGPEIVGAVIMGGSIGAGAALIVGAQATAEATAAASNLAVQSVNVGKHRR